MPGSSGGSSAPCQRAPSAFESASWIVRTALCVEPRAGVLHVFMPPLPRLEEYLDLVHALEDTAAALALPVRIEGYHPPADPRLAKLEVTPDPGVIEVNVPPAHSWDELVANTSQQSYAAGSADLLELIEAQRALLDVRLLIAEVRIERERRAAEIEQLAGIDLETLAQGEGGGREG